MSGKEHKCDHWITRKKPHIHKVKCDEPAKWEVTGWTVVYGIPKSGYFCDEHVELNGPGTFPKIGSNFPMKVKKLETDSMTDVVDCKLCSAFWKERERCIVYSKPVTDSTQAKTCRAFCKRIKPS